MSVTVTIRNLPTETRDELASRAARGGQSLQEYLRMSLMAIAAQPTLEDVIARARARVSATGTTITRSDILIARDADRP